VRVSSPTPRHLILSVLGVCVCSIECVYWSKQLIPEVMELCSGRGRFLSLTPWMFSTLFLITLGQSSAVRWRGLACRLPRFTRLLVITHTCQHRYTHLSVVRLTWTPSLPWLPSRYMSLPLVLSPGVIVSVSCLCIVRGSCFVLWSVYLIKTLTPGTCFPNLWISNTFKK
jgi:hypothetical protein